ncbi:MAG: TolC family protein [Acidobacteriota bacterium]
MTPKPFGLLLAAALTLSAGAAERGAEEPRALGLETVVDLALEQNAALRAETARRAEVAGGVDEAAADAWPEVDLVASWNRSRNPALLNSPDFEDIVDLFPDFEPGEQELWSLAVEVEQPIYSGGKVRAALELAELAVDITDAQIRAAELDTALDAAELYYRLLAALAEAETVDAQEAARRASLDVVDARYELGEATELERLRAVAALEEVGPVAADVTGRIAVARSRLKAILGLDPRTPIEVHGGETRQGAKPPTFDALLDVARGRRPELADLRLQIDALARQRTVTRADGRPQLDLTGAYGRQVRLLENLDDPLFADWRVTVGFSWNLFDGGRRAGQVAQLDSQRDQLRWRLLDLERTVAFEIQERLVAYDTALRRRTAALSAARAAGEAARVAQESYRLGVALQADLLDAQDQAVRRQLAADDAELDVRIQAARLRRAVGLLPTEALEAPPGPSSTQNPATPSPSTPEEGAP